MIHNALRRPGKLLVGIKNALGMAEADAGVERLSETLTPIINPWGLPEWASLRGEGLWAGWRLQSAVAAQNGYVGIVNPSTSNNIIVVDGFHVRTGAVTDVTVSRQTYNAVLSLRETNNIACPARDSRFSAAGFSAARISVGGAAGLLATAAQTMESLASANAANIVGYSPPTILLPNEALIVEANTVNINISVAFWGRVRPFLPGEQRP